MLRTREASGSASGAAQRAGEQGGLQERRSGVRDREGLHGKGHVHGGLRESRAVPPASGEGHSGPRAQPCPGPGGSWLSLTPGFTAVGVLGGGRTWNPPASTHQAELQVNIDTVHLHGSILSQYSVKLPPSPAGPKLSYSTRKATGMMSVTAYYSSPGEGKHTEVCAGPRQEMSRLSCLCGHCPFTDVPFLCV